MGDTDLLPRRNHAESFHSVFARLNLWSFRWNDPRRISLGNVLLHTKRKALGARVSLPTRIGLGRVGRETLPQGDRMHTLTRAICATYGIL